MRSGDVFDETAGWLADCAQMPLGELDEARARRLFQIHGDHEPCLQLQAATAALVRFGVLR